MLVPLGAPGGGPREVEAPDGRRFAVFPAEDGFWVSDAGCPHRQGPLVDGRREGAELVCPSHWYRFDLDSGVCATDPRLRLAVYPVLRRDETWFADVGEAPVARSWSERLRAHARGEAPA